MNNYRSEMGVFVVFIPKSPQDPRLAALLRLAEQRESRVERASFHIWCRALGCAGDRISRGRVRSTSLGSLNFVGQHFWARGYYVSTVGQDERVVREYVQQQEREDRRLEQLRLEE